MNGFLAGLDPNPETRTRPVFNSNRDPVYLNYYYSFKYVIKRVSIWKQLRNSQIMRQLSKDLRVRFK